MKPYNCEKNIHDEAIFDNCGTCRECREVKARWKPCLICPFCSCIQNDNQELDDYERAPHICETCNKEFAYTCVRQVYFTATQQVKP